MLVLPVDRARALCLAVFGHLHFTESEADDCTRAILFASLRGLDTHGIVSILPGIARSVKNGQTQPDADVLTLKDNRATAMFKGNRAAGPVVASRAMRTAIERARHYGIGATTAVHCAHFGAASAYAAMALPEQMFGLVMCNAHPVVAPFGGASPLHGTNPLAYAAPTADMPPIVLDIATSAAAHGQIAKALRRGQPVPPEWALDSEGRRTTDAQAAMKGVLLPFGGHKGYGMGILVDLLTGALTGSTVGLTVQQQNPDPDIGGQAFFFLAIDPECFGGRETFLARVDQLVRDAKSVKAAEGFSEVLLPGELEWREEQRRSKSGIPLQEADWSALVAGLEAAGLPRDLIDAHAPVEA
ncbi:MAG: Ldh family oxidoreductase [Chloroflexi bacterium]|nr:Ldh family oxidoreductase [Chloroflexota bacterium]